MVLKSYSNIPGRRKKSLSPSGAAAAFIVGLLTMAVPLHTFGISLIVFYLVGSRATKVGKALKASLEEDHQEAGYRDAMQVLSNSFTALTAATVWAVLFAPESIHYFFYNSLGLLNTTQPLPPYNGKRSCAVDATWANGLSRKLVFVALGHFACCLGDTLASELGILSKSNPILITTFRRVPPGTNGALSALGTASSALGGAIMGLTAGITLLEYPACWDLYPGGVLPFMIELILYGGFAGLVGSGIDSLLGATVQQTRYSIDSKKILQDHSSVQEKQGVKVISGLNLLTNNQVNVVSSLMTAFLLGWMA